MPLDQYSPCPCGSGKKMKFCKCVEQPQEYEKLIRLIEGGQELAAMDRINQMLAKTPNAAWLLALKGELSLGMQEVDTFKDTAHRFLKLKPDNPLALIMNSLAAALDNAPAENVANYLLEGLGESRESLPSMTLMALEMLIQSLANSGRLSMAGYWGEIQQMLAGDQRPEGDSVLQDASLNLIAKVPSKVIDDPPGSAWKERLAEVLSLSRTFRFAQAETKLRSILRDFPDQPGPLSHLLRAQMAQLNQSGAHATAQKLAEHLQISLEDRTYFAALALEIEPEQKSLQSELIFKYCEVDSIERIIEALNHLGNVDSIDGESADQIKQFYAAMVQDEVPAKQIYSVFNRALKPDAGNSEAGDAVETERLIASSVCTVVLFAKQTDKPARALFLATRFSAYQPICDEVLGILQLGAELADFTASLSRSYSEFLGRPKVIVGRREQPSLEESGSELVKDFLNLPLRLFSGATPLEAAKDERFRGPLLGLLSHLEGEQGLLVPQNAIDRIYQQLDLQRPSSKADIVAGNFRITNILDLDRLKLEELSDQHLQGVLLRAMNLGASRTFYHCSLVIRQRESLADQTQTQVVALSALKMFAPTFEQKIGYCRELIDCLASIKASVGKLVIELVSLLNASGLAKEAEQTLMQATQDFPEDPYLLSFLQYLMQSQRGNAASQSTGFGPDQLANRMLQHATRPEPESGSSLVLPGQTSSAPQGESKLWLPGT